MYCALFVESVLELIDRLDKALDNLIQENEGESNP